MKLMNPCMECFKENGAPTFIGSAEFHQELSDKYDVDSFYLEMTCPNGHHTITWMQAFRFEVLFDFAMRCFAKEDYEASVSYFGAAKERFCWFFVKFALRKINNSNPITEKFYKHVKNSSQMQEGIFLAAYSILFDRDALKFDDNTQKIRNAVVHNGQFVGKDEAKKYGEAVLTFIVEILNEMKIKFSNFYLEECEERAKILNSIKELKDKKIDAGSSMCSVFLSKAEIDDDFDKLLENYKKDLELFSEEKLQGISATLTALIKNK